MEVLLNDELVIDLIQRALYNNIRTGNGNRYFNLPPQGGYIVNEEYEYLLPDNNNVSALVFLDIVSRFGSPGSDSLLNERYKEHRKKKIKQLGKYRKIKENDPLINEQCSICIEDFCCGDYQRTLNCKHSFHKKCIDKWFRKDKNDCPMCRTNIISNE